jgi:hypothetical protein
VHAHIFLHHIHPPTLFPHHLPPSLVPTPLTTPADLLCPPIL